MVITISFKVLSNWKFYNLCHFFFFKFFNFLSHIYILQYNCCQQFLSLSPSFPPSNSFFLKQFNPPRVKELNEN